MGNVLQLLAMTVSTFFQIYTVLIFIRILLSWFPNINWYDPPFSILSQLTDPYLNVFRQFIPPLGGIDFSPMIAIFLLQIVAGLVPQLLFSLAYAASSMSV
ncbi:MAG: YggT family protein [Microcoleaceae cyanobacterium]